MAEHSQHGGARLTSADVNCAQSPSLQNWRTRTGKGSRATRLEKTARHAVDKPRADGWRHYRAAILKSQGAKSKAAHA